MLRSRVSAVVASCAVGLMLAQASHGRPWPAQTGISATADTAVTGVYTDRGTIFLQVGVNFGPGSQ